MPKPCDGWVWNDASEIVQIEWTETALDDIASLDKGLGRRVKQSVERFAENRLRKCEAASGNLPARVPAPCRRLSRPLLLGRRHYPNSPCPQPPRSLPLTSASGDTPN